MCLPGFAGDGILCGEDEVKIQKNIEDYWVEIFKFRIKMAFHQHNWIVHLSIAKKIIVLEKQTQVISLKFLL